MTNTRKQHNKNNVWIEMTAWPYKTKDWASSLAQKQFRGPMNVKPQAF